MGAVKQKTAWVLIGIFQVFLMHQALPHEHHTHDSSPDKSIPVKDSHHHHHDGSAHSHHPTNHGHSEQSGENNGLLDLLFGEHSHSSGINHRHLLTSSTVQNIKGKNTSGFSFKSLNFAVANQQLTVVPFTYTPPTTVKSQSNQDIRRRGPPSTV